MVRGIGTAAALVAGGAFSGGLLACHPAHAAGFGLREESAGFTAQAFVGAAAADDGLTVFENPAGMVRLQQSEIDGTINAIIPSVQFHGSDTIFGHPVPGGNGGEASPTVADGALFGVWSVTPRFKLGLAVTSPFGQRISYATNFVGRYQSLVTSATDFEITLAAAYAVDPHWSVAAGPVIDYFHSRFTQAVNIGINPLVGDPTVDLSGDDTSAGYVLGTMYQFDDDTRIGLTYHSRIEHTIGASQEVTAPPLLAAISPPTAAALTSASGPARVGVTLPDNLKLGIFHRFDSRWSMMADGQWTDWSLFHTLTATPTSGARPTVLHENFRNTWFGGVAAAYQATPRLKLQAGVSYDETPVQDQYRNSRLPDSSRTVLGAGFTFAVLPNADLQLGYSHVFAPDVPIAESESVFAGLLAGSYQVSGNTVSAGYRYRF